MSVSLPLSPCPPRVCVPAPVPVPGTFSPLENEGNVAHALRQHPCLALVSQEPYHLGTYGDYLFFKTQRLIDCD